MIQALHAIPQWPQLVTNLTASCSYWLPFFSSQNYPSQTPLQMDVAMWPSWRSDPKGNSQGRFQKLKISGGNSVACIFLFFPSLLPKQIFSSSWLTVGGETHAETSWTRKQRTEWMDEAPTAGLPSDTRKNNPFFRFLVYLWTELSTDSPGRKCWPLNLCLAGGRWDRIIGTG